MVTGGTEFAYTAHIVDLLARIECNKCLRPIFPGKLLILRRDIQTTTETLYHPKCVPMPVLEPQLAHVRWVISHAQGKFPHRAHEVQEYPARRFPSRDPGFLGLTSTAARDKCEPEEETNLSSASSGWNYHSNSCRKQRHHCRYYQDYDWHERTQACNARQRCFHKRGPGHFPDSEIINSGPFSNQELKTSKLEYIGKREMGSSHERDKHEYEQVQDFEQVSWSLISEKGGLLVSPDSDNIEGKKYSEGLILADKASRELEASLQSSILEPKRFENIYQALTQSLNRVKDAPFPFSKLAEARILCDLARIDLILERNNDAANWLKIIKGTPGVCRVLAISNDIRWIEETLDSQLEDESSLEWQLE